jgi:hypothetical protein
MGDDEQGAERRFRILPLTVEDLRKLNGLALNDATRQILLEQLEQLTPDRRDDVIALMNMLLLTLRVIPAEHHDAVHIALALFARLTDEQRAAYLKLRARAERKREEA